MGEIEVSAPLHSDPLHDTPTGLIGGDGERNDAVDVEVDPGPVESRLGGFASIALPPHILAQAPADFHVTVERSAGQTRSFETAIAEEGAVGFAAHRPDAQT